jgi:uncharacterized protein
MAKVNGHAPGSVTWVDLMTTDVEAARRFYGEVLGWSFDIGPPETGFYTTSKVQGDNVAGMGQLPPGAPFPPAWTVYFATVDVDASAARIRELGGQVMMGPIDVTEEGRMLVAMDPCGAAFGLWQPLRHTGAQRVDEPGAMCWREVNVRDVPAARAFYTALFGLEARPLPDPAMVYETLHLGEQTVGGILFMNEMWPKDVPPHWMNYFAVDDLDAALERVKAGGGKVVVPPFDTPYGRISVITDPAGAVVTLMKMDAPPTCLPFSEAACGQETARGLTSVPAAVQSPGPCAGSLWSPVSSRWLRPRAAQLPRRPSRPRRPPPPPPRPRRRARHPRRRSPAPGGGTTTSRCSARAGPARIFAQVRSATSSPTRSRATSSPSWPTAITPAAPRGSSPSTTTSSRVSWS